MGTGIDGPPNTYPAGLEFDYSVWTPGTVVDILNVRWDNAYRDVVSFDSKEAINAYINSQPKLTINYLSYAKPGEDIYVNVPFNAISRYNYIRASNPLMPIDGDLQKDYYYFIIECEYISPNNTRLRLQLDIWTTYFLDLEIGNCYVERGHIGIANENGFSNYGRNYLSIAEGLDIGAEYRTIARKSEVLIKNALVASDESIDGDIIVVSTIDLASDPGTVTNPKMVTAKGSQINGMPSGADFYIFTSQFTFAAFMSEYADKPWVTQGVISVSYMPSVSRYQIGPPPVDGAKAVQLFTMPIMHDMFTNWRNSQEFLSAIPERYRHLKKFFTYPYMVIEMTTWTGNPIILKPESWNNADAEVMERVTYLPPNQRVEFIPRGYNAVTGAPVDNLFDISDSRLAEIAATSPELANLIRDAGDDSGDYLNMAVSVAHFPSLPIVNNMAINYLASNANQIPFQFRSADWSQQRTLAAAQAQYDVATGGIRAATDITNLGIAGNIGQTANQNRTLAAQAAVNATAQAVSGIGNALTPGGFGGAAISGLASGIATGVNAGIQTQANDESLSISNNQASQINARQNAQTGLSRDVNNSLARFSANGDYANTIAGINAKIQDAQLIQPSVGGQFGGESVNIASNKLEMSIRWKLIDEANMRKIGDIWLRYGYAIQNFISVPKNLKVMTKFSYWKMQETYIQSANVPEGHKQTIRGILEKGVTVWSNPNEIGSIDLADNAPLGGISY